MCFSWNSERALDWLKVPRLRPYVPLMKVVLVCTWALVKWHWRCKTKVFGGKSVTPPIFPLTFDMDLLRIKCGPLQLRAEKIDNTFLFIGLRLPKERCFLEGLRASPFLFLVRATCRWRWVWSTDGMILAGKNWSTGRKSYPSVTFYTTNSKWTVLGSNTNLHGEMLASNRLSLVFNLKYIHWFSSNRTVKSFHL